MKATTTILSNSPQEAVSCFGIIEFSSFSVKQLVVERTVHPWLYPDFIYYKTASGKRFMELIRIIHNFSSSVSVCNKEIRTPKQTLTLQTILILTE
jgi:hypothetical protein